MTSFFKFIIKQYIYLIELLWLDALKHAIFDFFAGEYAIRSLIFGLLQVENAMCILQEVDPLRRVLFANQTVEL